MPYILLFRNMTSGETHLKISGTTKPRIDEALKHPPTHGEISAKARDLAYAPVPARSLPATANSLSDRARKNVFSWYELLFRNGSQDYFSTPDPGICSRFHTR